jgi:ribose-phosphate pyrophosphokinase
VGAGLAIIAKHRPEPDQNEVLEMVGDVEGKTAVIVDDLISTGGTLAEAADVLLDRGARCVLAYAVHAALAADAPAKIRYSNLERVVVTNTAPIPPDCRDDKIEIIKVDGLIAEAIRRIHEGRSVSALFQSATPFQEVLI